MLVHPAALLALDEPTNHLDLVSREVLEEALAVFPGTIVFISHDRYFINRVATRIVEVQAGALTPYLGGFDDYREAKAAALASAVNGPPAPGPRVSAVAAAPSRPGPASEVRALRRRRDDVEAQIHALEGRLRELTVAFGDPLLYANGERVRAMTRERRETETGVASLMREWEALSSRLAAHD
jgi:ATP-binding cassette subfamily F protein 3